jgi:hypothetical protein
MKQQLLLVMSLLAFTGVLAGADQPEVRMKAIQMDRITFEIPEAMKWKNQNGTLIAMTPGSEGLVLRVSVNTVLKDGVPVPGAGARVISKQATERKLTLMGRGNKVWFQTKEDASEGPPGSVMRYWYVGFDAQGLVISCYVDAAHLGSLESQELLKAAAHVIESLKVRE